MFASLRETVHFYAGTCWYYFFPDVSWKIGKQVDFSRATDKLTSTEIKLAKAPEREQLQKVPVPRCINLHKSKLCITRSSENPQTSWSQLLAKKGNPNRIIQRNFHRQTKYSVNAWLSRTDRKHVRLIWTVPTKSRGQKRWHNLGSCSRLPSHFVCAFGCVLSSPILIWNCVQKEWCMRYIHHVQNVWN